jgi:DNA-binding MarR family transcriptional regulator
MSATGDDLKASLTGQAAILSELASAYIEPTLKQQGLNLGTFELLSAVQASKGQAKQNELAERLGITPPSLCEALKSAVKKGFVEQVASPTDQRAKMVRLTNKGSKALDFALLTINQMETRLRNSLDSQKLNESIRILAEANKVLAMAIQQQQAQNKR